jgi:hypothetical protein
MNLDRFGEPTEPPVEDDDPSTHDPRCRNGWIDRDADHPVPCLVCRPKLAPEERRRRAGIEPERGQS